MSAGVHTTHNDHAGNPTTNNPIYDSIEDDVEHLEQMISIHDTNFNSVTKEVWRNVVSPSSSISSINTSDSEDEDFSGYFTAGCYSITTQHLSNNNFCDKTEEDSLNESRISLQDINMQIGVAEELVLTPNSRQKHNNKHLFNNLETIHEGKFLHTPPKNVESKERTTMKPSTMFLDRLERDD